MNFIISFFSVVVGILMSAMSAQAQTRVQTYPLEELVISVARSVPAQVISLREAVIASQLTSTVTNIPLLVGDIVTENQVLANLDCIDNDLSLEQSRAELSALSANRVLASQQLERLNKLRKSNNASEEEINQKQAELNVVSARIKAQSIAININERQVQKCRIQAPFPGVVTEIHSEQGNFVTPGSPVISITDTKNIELSARVNSSELEQISNSNTLLFLYNDKTYPLSIRTTLDVVDSTSQSQHMRLNFLEAKPLAGANGRLQWSLSGSILPASLVVSRNDEHGIFIIDENESSRFVARFHPIHGVNPGQPARVHLDPETLVVVDGRLGLEDGDEVKVD